MFSGRHGISCVAYKVKSGANSFLCEVIQYLSREITIGEVNPELEVKRRVCLGWTYKVK